MKAVLIVSHGSRLHETKQEVMVLVEKLRERAGVSIIDYAFLEIESPTIPEGIDRCVVKGATEIIVALNFLNSGRHVDHDIPRIISTAREKYPQVLIKVTPPVGQDEAIIEIFLKMIK